MDSAFFGERMIRKLDELKVEYAISVPFEGVQQLKGMVKEHSRWRTISGSEGTQRAFEKSWKPGNWDCEGRFLFVRSENATTTARSIRASGIWVRLQVRPHQ